MHKTSQHLCKCNQAVIIWKVSIQIKVSANTHLRKNLHNPLHCKHWCLIPPEKYSFTPIHVFLIVVETQRAYIWIF